MASKSNTKQIRACGHMAQETTDLVLSRIGRNTADASTPRTHEWTITTATADVMVRADLIEHQANTSSGLLLCPECLVRSLTELVASADPRIRDVKVYMIHQMTWIYWKKGPVPSDAFPPRRLSILPAVDATEALRCASKYRRVDQFGAVVALSSIDTVVDEHRRAESSSAKAPAQAITAAIMYEDPRH